MTSAFDQRVVKVGLEIDGEVVTFEGLSIYASGRKYANVLSGECHAKIFNVTKAQQTYILSQFSPFNQRRNPINMTLDVGRESYGTFRLFEGGVFQCGATQPPDIGIFLRSLSNNFLTSVIAGATQPPQASMKTIAQSIAKAGGLTLDFQATDKQVGNWSVNGSLWQQVNKLGQVGGVDVFVDNTTLVVLDGDKSRAGEPRLIDATNGMVGVPQVTDTGVLVKVMIDNSIQTGGSVTVSSEINPGANGTYKVAQLNYEVASRDQPFWYTLGCSTLSYYQGTQG